LNEKCPLFLSGKSIHHLALNKKYQLTSIQIEDNMLFILNMKNEKIHIFLCVLRYLKEWKYLLNLCQDEGYPFLRGCLICLIGKNHYFPYTILCVFLRGSSNIDFSHIIYRMLIAYYQFTSLITRIYFVSTLNSTLFCFNSHLSQLFNFFPNCDPDVVETNLQIFMR
jgi:hypothetical protein